MRVPFEWLKEFIDISASAYEVADRLTMIGLEIEALERIDEDFVFEINVTPNRPDCLSVIGIVRELSAVYGIPYKLPNHIVVAEPKELDFNVDILDIDLCHRYAGRIVKNLNIGHSPDWLKKRLEKCGIRSINNIVDVTNYVMLELGHPLHAFDLDSIEKGIIRIGTSETLTGQKKTVKLKSLDGIEREISHDALLIWDGRKPIAIAGVIGGMDTEVKDSTHDVFIESAYFVPESIRRTSKALGLKTESSYRFERGADIKMLKKALDRAVYLLQKLAGGVVYGKIDIYPKRHKIVDIPIKIEKINKILGLELNKREILDCMHRLGFDVEGDENELIVRPPSHRRDISREADIIEEVARIYGYNKIPATLPMATIGISDYDSETNKQKLNIKNNIKQSLLKSGFTEVINYSFIGMHDIELLEIQKNDRRRSLVALKNPLRAEDSFMRTTLIPSLIKNMIHNVSHGNREFRLFEMSKVFINTGHGSEAEAVLPLETECLAAMYYKEKGKTLHRDSVPDFYIVKGIVEAIFNDIKICEYSFVKTSEPFLHPGQSADIFIMDDKIGYVGAISPLILDSIDIKAYKPAVFVFELDVEKLVSYALQVVKYRPLPRYPYIERDTAILVDLSLEAALITKLLRAYPSDLIEDVYIFDVYRGKNIPDDKKSIAFNIRYRASDRTLKDEEIDELHKAIVSYILDNTKGQLRQ